MYALPSAADVGDGQGFAAASPASEHAGPSFRLAELAERGMVARAIDGGGRAVSGVRGVVVTRHGQRSGCAELRVVVGPANGELRTVIDEDASPAVAQPAIAVDVGANQVVDHRVPGRFFNFDPGVVVGGNQIANCAANDVAVGHNMNALLGIADGDRSAGVGTNKIPIDHVAVTLQFDQYGGWTSVQCPNGATTHFYTQKVNNRWWICTPAGNA